LNILHLASFVGNQGDLTNHKNFRTWFDEVTKSENIWKQIEIRGFFRNEYKYEEFFPEFANQFDLLVIGGGNFFELWPSNSWSGTSIGLTPEMLDKLNVPIFINSIGVDAAQGISENAKDNFATFIELLLKKNALISVRNDGSYDEINRHVTESIMQKIHILPDAGFFCINPNLPVKKNSYTYIAINLAIDMKEKRFESQLENGYQLFISNFAADIEWILSNAFVDKIMFTSHIYSDLEIALDVVEKLSEKSRRERVIFSQFGPDEVSNQVLTEAYFDAELTIAMRFHANLIPIGLGRPTVGINTYPQVSKMYREIQMEDNALSLDQINRVVGLRPFIEKHFKNPNSTIKKSEIAKLKIEKQRAQFRQVLENWLYT
jgi:polysaccharide pyruvyl transferase WcaK-like protein